MSPVLKVILLGGVVILLAVACLHANYYATMHGVDPITLVP
jgi:hypothetical protein